MNGEICRLSFLNVGLGVVFDIMLLSRRVKRLAWQPAETDVHATIERILSFDTLGFLSVCWLFTPFRDYVLLINL